VISKNLSGLTNRKIDVTTVYSKTTKGIQAINHKGKRLPANLMRVLTLVDGKSTAEEILAKSGDISLAALAALRQALTDLSRDGYIKTLASAPHADFMSDPGLPAAAILVAETGEEDFFKELAKIEARKKAKKIAEQQRQGVARTPVKEAAASAQVEKQTHNEPRKQTGSEARLLAESKAEVLRKPAESTDENSGHKAYEEAGAKALEKENREAAAKAAIERKAQEEAEEKARAKARANRRLEARAREEAERKAREEAEAKKKAEAEERARREAEEAARAEKAAREKAEAEARAREEAERKAREEAEAKKKAEAEERARREAEEAARAEKAAQAKAEAEARAREEAERKAIAKAEAKAKAEAEEHARQEAEETARAEKAAKEKALAEAERKAREKAEEEERERAEIEARARVLAEKRALEEEKVRQKANSNPRKARKPVEWGRIALISLAMLVVLPLVLLHVMSLKAFIPSIEKIAEEKLHEPVAISDMHASLWPVPHLRLDDITIGKARDVKIATIRAMPELGTLFEDVKTLKSIEIDSLLLDPDTLPRVIGWVGLGGDSGNVRVSRISLKNTKISLKDVPLPPVNADITLTTTGKFDMARMTSVDDKIKIEVAPRNGEFDVNIAAKGWQPPLGPQITFEELTAKATANREGMRISEIQGRLYEGAIKGAAMVKWGEFWAAEGNFNVSRIALDLAMPALGGDFPLSGRLDAEATYSMKAGSLARLFDAPHIKASFKGRDGVIGNIDLARAVQARTPEAIKGGQTRFAGLSGNMTLTDSRYQFRRIELSAGQFNAGGEADVTPGRELSGKLNAEVKFKSSAIRSRLALSGSLTQPVLRREGLPSIPAR
jgi:hypothetical protein